MARSRTIPTSAHQVRAADIDVVAALGDSLTAANGAGALDPVAILLQYRGLAFQIGGDKGLDEHITIPNILKKFNPHLFGASYGIGATDVWEVSYLNVAQPGASACTGDMADQARLLVHKMQTHKEVDMENHWKLVNIFIGGNDMCGYCHHPTTNTPELFGRKIQEAVQILYDHLPRTIVSLTGMFHLEMLRQVDTGQFFCQALHVHECQCESETINFNDTFISQSCVAYMHAEYAIETSGIFDQRDDFTFVVQPFLQDVIIPPQKPDGSEDLSFFCPDCFHFAQRGHAIVAKHLWNTMMQPVGSKQTNISLSMGHLPPLACPDATCPYIRTTKNSVNCQATMI